MQQPQGDHLTGLEVGLGAGLSHKKSFGNLGTLQIPVDTFSATPGGVRMAIES